ncbi:MAG: F0F1 ATP synthase subunit A [bacterium]
MSHGFGYNGNLGYFLFFGGIVTGMAAIFAFWVNFRKKKDGVPGGIQNIGEAIVEFLVNLIEPVLGEKLVLVALPFLGTLFLYILFSNLLLIFPYPFSNPPTGDISVTVALAFICVFGLQFYSFFIVNGPKKALKMLFNPIPGLTSGDDHDSSSQNKKEKKKGIWDFLLRCLKNVPAQILVLVFLVLKMVDNVARLLSLSLRLFGNVYGEHTILGETMNIAIAKPALVVTLCIPFIILCFDVMVAVIQAVVFTNLSLFYMKEEWGVHD